MQANSGYGAFAETLAPPRGLPRYAVLAALVAGGSAFTALCAQFEIRLPFTPVPITGQTFAVLTVGGLLGSRLGAASLLLYMLEGIVGLLWGSQEDGFKVFGGGANGWEVIVGPTGGYIIGFIAAAYVVGWLAERGFDRRPWSLALAMAVGNVVIYVFGLPWLDHFFPGKALEFGLYPFVAGDAAKLLLAASLVPLGRSLLAQVPGVEEAMPAPGRLALRQYVPTALIYAAIGLLVIIGATLSWGEPGGGHDAGWNQTSGQVALAAGGAALLLVILPLPSMHLLAVALIVVGALLPFDVLPDSYTLNVDQVAGLVALAAALAATATLVVVALPKLERRAAMRIGQFALGALAGYASYYHIVQILTKSEDFALGDLGPGLILAALASVLLVAVSVLDQPQAPSEE